MYGIMSPCPHPCTFSKPSVQNRSCEDSTVPLKWQWTLGSLLSARGWAEGWIPKHNYIKNKCWLHFEDNSVLWSPVAYHSLHSFPLNSCRAWDPDAAQYGNPTTLPCVFFVFCLHNVEMQQCLANTLLFHMFGRIALFSHGSIPILLQKKRMLHDAEEQKWEKLRVSFISQFSWLVILSGSVPVLSADSKGEIWIVFLSFNSNKKNLHSIQKFILLPHLAGKVKFSSTK